MQWNRYLIQRHLASTVIVLDEPLKVYSGSSLLLLISVIRSLRCPIGGTAAHLAALPVGEDEDEGLVHTLHEPIGQLVFQNSVEINLRRTYMQVIFHAAISPHAEC